MGEYTLLRIDVDAGVVAMVLDAIPGVSVADDAIDAGDEPAASRRPAPVDTQPRTDVTAPPADRQRYPPTPGETPPPSVAGDGPEDEGGIKAMWQQWGLLGVGALLVATGLAIVGLWWYRRRSGGDDEEPHLSSDDRPVSPRSARRRPTGSSDAAESRTASSLSRSERPSGRDTDTASVADEGGTDSEDGDRSDAERDVATEPSADSTETVLGETPDRESEPTVDESGTDDRALRSRLRPSWPQVTPKETKMDIAPLLGMAFLVVSAAVVRWATRGRDRET